MRHDDKLLRSHFARHDALAQAGVGFVLEVLEERADLGFVGFVCFGAVFREGGRFDGGGVGEDGRGADSRGVGEAVVDEANAVVAGGLVRAFDVDFVVFIVALVGRDAKGGHF